MKDKACENCYYAVIWSKLNRVNYLECHRYPKQIVADSEEFEYFYPCVYPNDWCGEFKERE